MLCVLPKARNVLSPTGFATTAVGKIFTTVTAINYSKLEYEDIKDQVRDFSGDPLDDLPIINVQMRF